VLSPGVWNRLEGPDFLRARILADGKPVEGDVEVHFSESDWKSHGHERDEHYQKVVLHVLYHPPLKSSPADGGRLASVALLPLLWYSLEEYASEDSLLASTGLALAAEVEPLLGLQVSCRRRRLVAGARRRWRMKLHFARQRIERLGWERACHQSVLEAMGYARNRIPMLMLAERARLDDFREGRYSIEELLEFGDGRWRTIGMRPASHPRLRLRQYADLCRESPDWPRKARAALRGPISRASELQAFDCGSGAARKELGISRLRLGLFAEALAGKVSKGKGDTVVCDALLPLACAEAAVDAFSLWFHWYPGNAPEACERALRELEILRPREIPLSNGWIQGVLAQRSEG